MYFLSHVFFYIFIIIWNGSSWSSNMKCLPSSSGMLSRLSSFTSFSSSLSHHLHKTLHLKSLVQCCLLRLHPQKLLHLNILFYWLQPHFGSFWQALLAIGWSVHSGTLFLLMFFLYHTHKNADRSNFFFSIILPQQWPPWYVVLQSCWSIAPKIRGIFYNLTDLYSPVDLSYHTTGWRTVLEGI